MTRTYAARKLLEHGPLTLSEFLQITRWPYRTAQRTLENLQEVGLVVAESCGQHRNLYRLT